MPDWPTLIADEQRRGTRELRATHFDHRYGSHQAPVRFACGTDGLWVAKGHSFAQGATTETVVHSLGQALGAPVPRFGIIEVSATLVRRERQLQNYPAGRWFCSQFVPGIKDLLSDLKQGACLHPQLRENRRRYALLAVLYGWAGTWSDIQFIYETNSPCLVHSVDHGHFFPGGPTWTVASLNGAAPAAALDQFIMGQVSLTSAELRVAAQAFLRMDRPAVIAAAVARPLDGWGVQLQDRVALAEYLNRRGDVLASDLGSQYAV